MGSPDLNQGLWNPFELTKYIITLQNVILDGLLQSKLQDIDIDFYAH